MNDSVLYSVFRFILPRVFRLLFGYKITGVENIPAEGGLILCSNHASFLDPPLVGSCIWQRQIGYFARDTLFRNPLFGWVIRTLHAFPIKRGAVDRAALQAFKERVEAGAGVLVFPEGTRSPDGQLQKGKAGVGMLIHGCPGATVVPVRVHGSEKAWPKGAWFIRMEEISVNFGPPLDLHPEYSLPEERPTFDRITEKVMAAIAAL
jgi:1-acyl-sn-glycerol-3-phosphate acyltransferase